MKSARGTKYESLNYLAPPKSKRSLENKPEERFHLIFKKRLYISSGLFPPAIFLAFLDPWNLLGSKRERERDSLESAEISIVGSRGVERGCRNVPLYRRFWKETRCFGKKHIGNHRGVRVTQTSLLPFVFLNKGVDALAEIEGTMRFSINLLLSNEDLDIWIFKSWIGIEF